MELRFHKISVPEFEDQQVPELPGAVADSFPVARCSSLVTTLWLSDECNEASQGRRRVESRHVHGSVSEYHGMP